MAKFEPDLNLIFSALGDPTRRAIISRLGRGPATVSELAAPHDMALPTFLGHLNKLETAGLIASVKSGRIRTCRLSDDAFAPAQDWLAEQRAVWTSRLDRFDAYIETLAKDPKDGS